MRQQLELPQPWPLAIVYDCDRPLWAGAPDAAEAVEQVGVPCCYVGTHSRAAAARTCHAHAIATCDGARCIPCGMFAWHLSWCIPRCISVVRNAALCMPQCHLRVRYVCCVSGRELCAAVSCCTVVAILRVTCHRMSCCMSRVGLRVAVACQVSCYVLRERSHVALRRCNMQRKPSQRWRRCFC